MEVVSKEENRFIDQSMSTSATIAVNKPPFGLLVFSFLPTYRLADQNN